MNCPNCGCHLTIHGSTMGRSIPAYSHRGSFDIPRGGWHSKLEPPGFSSHSQPEVLSRQNHEAAAQNLDALRAQREEWVRSLGGRSIIEREYRAERDFETPELDRDLTRGREFGDKA